MEKIGKINWLFWFYWIYPFRLLATGCYWNIYHSRMSCSVFCSNVEMLLWKIIPWIKGWFVCDVLCLAQCGNEGTLALSSQKQGTVPVAQQWPAAQWLCFSWSCFCPEMVGAVGVEVSRPNFPRRDKKRYIFSPRSNCQSWKLNGSLGS